MKVRFLEKQAILGSFIQYIVQNEWAQSKVETAETVLKQGDLAGGGWLPLEGRLADWDDQSVNSP